jgi:hypothetical protein
MYPEVFSIIELWKLAQPLANTAELGERSHISDCEWGKKCDRYFYFNLSTTGQIDKLFLHLYFLKSVNPHPIYLYSLLLKKERPLDRDVGHMQS